ncbi:hypothetical protein AVEN_235999-1 [Araneus ventricosus]|uniref:Uncharacterized protein n=1 Tax=Araneus ventricosus TaxID=182803 RepID=A0A4Y2M1A0_ARAVE|nr:hypothetical protein AVEN_235999-1 [Araneus ventricosus]
MTFEKYVAMLHSLVESARPEDLIKEWEQMRCIVENKDKTNILRNLLEFFRSEVESDDSLQLARSGERWEDVYVIPATTQLLLE